jgi:hypothetical protein
VDSRELTVDELVAAGWPREGAEEYVAEEPLNRQMRQWAAQREARRAVDPKYDRYCLEREAQELEESARHSEEVAGQMERGEFDDSPIFMGDADIANMRYCAAEHRRWARERRVKLIRATHAPRVESKTRMPWRPNVQTPRPRERRPQRRATQKARPPSRDPDEPAPPLGRFSEVEDWGGLAAVSIRLHAHVLRRAAAMRLA